MQPLQLSGSRLRLVLDVYRIRLDIFHDPRVDVF